MSKREKTLSGKEFFVILLVAMIAFVFIGPQREEIDKFLPFYLRTPSYLVGFGVLLYILVAFVYLGIKYLISMIGKRKS